MTSVRTVSTNRSAKQFARGHRGGILTTLDARVRQDRVERGRELPGPITDQEPKPGGTVAEIHDEVTGLLRGPRPVGMPGHAQHVHVAVADLEREQHVEPSTWKRSARQGDDITVERHGDPCVLQQRVAQHSGADAIQDVERIIHRPQGDAGASDTDQHPQLKQPRTKIRLPTPGLAIAALDVRSRSWPSAVTSSEDRMKVI